MGEKVTSKLGSLVTQSESHVRNLGVIMDCELNFKSHMQFVTKMLSTIGGT